MHDGRAMLAVIGMKPGRASRFHLHLACPLRVGHKGIQKETSRSGLRFGHQICYDLTSDVRWACGIADLRKMSGLVRSWPVVAIMALRKSQLRHRMHVASYLSFVENLATMRISE